MPATINPIKKARLKKELLNPKVKSIRQAMINAGYSPNTAIKSGANKVVKVSQAEIAEDIKKKITVDTVLKGLCDIQKLAIADKDFSTATRCEELKGKWLAMFTDKNEISTVEKEENSFSVSRLAKLQAKN